MKFDVNESLYKAASNYLIDENIQRFDFFWGHFGTNVVVLDISVFSP